MPWRLTLKPNHKTLRRRMLVSRCGWVQAGSPADLAYHDKEWGVPVHDDRRWFELLILERFKKYGLRYEALATCYARRA